MKRLLRIAAIALAFVLIAAVMAGCGMSSMSDKNAESSTASAEGYGGDYTTTEEAEYDNGGPMEEPAPAEQEKSEFAPDATFDETVIADEVQSERKLTYYANVSMETKTYHETISGIEALVTEVGGYIGSSNIEDYGDDEEKTYSRYASFEIYVPAGSLDGFLSQLGDIANVRSTQKQVQDITQPYYDTKSRLDSLLEQEDRLLELQKDATLSETLEIEGYLSNIRYEINYLNNMMQVYEREIAMSTVSLSLTEVVDFTPPVAQDPSLGDKIVDAFKSSFEFFGDFGEGLLIVLIFLLPFLVISAIITVVIVVCVKKGAKRRAKKRAANPPKPPVYPPYPPMQAPQPIAPPAAQSAPEAPKPEQK